MCLRNKKGRLWTAVLLTTLLLSLALLPSQLVYGQASIGTLADCARMAFSTEEDFIAHDAAGKIIYVSDGDLLSPDGVICARNADLVRVFDVNEDLGLDAVDVLSVERNLVAFSTELDSPHGNFTAGDLLATNGAVIPNKALVMPFGVYYDMGLDAVHFVVRDLDSTVGFLNEVKSKGRDYWLREGALQGALRQWGVDVWFSTEGTAPQVGQPKFLDGDLLSARDGIIVIGQAALLPNTVPAGIPSRGVDFGLDAFAARTRDVQTARERGLFSTEILYWPDEGTGFTDGDALKVGDLISSTNWDLIQAFQPLASELGLDALSVATVGPPPECYAALTALGGTQAPIANLNSQGLVDLGYPTRHPFGNDIPFWGYLASCVSKFRVVYRAAGNTGDGTPILPGPWNVGDPLSWDPVTMTCVDVMPRPSPDAAGYYDAAEYAWLRQCDQLPLTSWNTYDEIGQVSIVPDGLYEVRLDYQVGATLNHSPWYRVRVDNTLPEIQALGLVASAGSPGGSASCPVYSTSNMPLMLQGQFRDDYFWRYQATIDGDLYPAHPYTVTNYYDGTPAAANLDDTGTTPDGSLVNLHHVNVYDIVSNPADCCYSIEVKVWDRAIWGWFYGYRAVVGGYVGRWVEDDIYFAFLP
ncbi:MAG: hypothetical protein QHJ81_09120 [Anaerolineae bacterium]|nr:hypothetical protein [Anaerolineae bacterium]